MQKEMTLEELRAEGDHICADKKCCSPGCKVVGVAIYDSKMKRGVCKGHLPNIMDLMR